MEDHDMSPPYNVQGQRLEKRGMKQMILTMRVDVLLRPKALLVFSVNKG